MKTSRQNHLKVPIIAFLMCVMQVNGASLTITQHPLYPNVSTYASLTCHIPSFTGGAEWLNNDLRLTHCKSSSCFPPSSTRYQYSANATTMTVTIPSVDIALDDNTWKCSHNSGTDTGDFNFTVYKLPSTLYIDGINSSILDEGDTVKLSVSTGCIHPSGSAHYTVIWKYVEATSAAENNFGTIIAQTITSVGGCQNTYLDNLMFNLFLTNDMNTGNTSISISQVKMTFTMAEISFNATKSVAYNVTANGTAAPTMITPDSSSTFSLPAVAGGIGAGVVVILMAVVALFLWRRYHHRSQHTDGTQRNQINARSVRHDASIGQDYEGLHINNTEASAYLHLNDIILEENRYANTRLPENDSYETLHPYTKNDTQMYSSLKTTKISKDSEKVYENTQIKATDFNC